MNKDKPVMSATKFLSQTLRVYLISFLAIVVFQNREITRNSDKIWPCIAVQGHPRSSILVSFESEAYYVTSY